MGKRINFPDKVIQQIKVDYQNGKSITDIARCFGVSTHKIRNTLDEQGIEFRRQKLTQEEIDSMRNMYSGGATIDQVARHFRRSNNTVKKYIDKKRGRRVSSIVGLVGGKQLKRPATVFILAMIEIKTVNAREGDKEALDFFRSGEFDYWMSQIDCSCSDYRVGVLPEGVNL